MKALFVEPSRFYQQLVGSLLRGAGFEITNFGSGTELLDSPAADSAWDLVCLPLLTGDMDGLELCRRLRSRPVLKNTPIILITSKEDESTNLEAIQAGVTEVFYKSDLQRLHDFIAAISVDISQRQILDARILYIEDSLATARVIMSWLEPLGLKIDHFDSGETAIEALKKNDYDLVITDFLLKGKISGLGIVREIRGGPQAYLPVLVISGFDDVSRKIEILRSGASDFVPKPVMEEELLARVRTLVSNKRMIDELEHQKKLLMEMALTDQLTSLYNRHCLMDIAPKQLSQAQRHGYPVSIMIVDVDNFKSINDLHGHQAGDEVLATIAGIMKECCRQGDYAARVGGEEFLILLNHCDAENARRRAEIVRSRIETAKPAGLPTTASFGVTELAVGQKFTFDQLFAAADKALYHSKTHGKNQVSFIAPN
jgi:two-component system cell cycle response regulator